MLARLVVTARLGWNVTFGKVIVDRCSPLMVISATSRSYREILLTALRSYVACNFRFAINGRHDKFRVKIST